MTQAANLAALGSNASSTGTLGASSFASATIPNSALSANPTFRNRIINGAMTFNQRGFSGTPDTQYTLDRWFISNTGANKFTISQNAGSVTPPAGFPNYLGATSSSAYVVPSGELYLIRQYIEGFNTADLSWGTASAKTVTLSFQVYSSLTGTFGGSIQNSANDRSYPFSYSIPVANTWTSIAITIPGDTTGTWIGATNGVGMRLNFSLGTGTTYSGTAGAWAGANYYSATGATSVVGTNGATFYITGVQLEVGSTASPFEVRSYGTELQLCQRYYQLVGGGTAQGGQSSTIIYWGCVLPVTMRTNPSLGQTAAQYFYKPGVDVWNQSSTGLTGSSSSPQGVYAGFTNISGVTTQAPYQWAVNYSGTPSYLTASAEL